jgi:uncharacterized lipoprotein
MIKNSISLTLLALAALSVSGCSWFKDRPAEYLESDEGQALQLPEGLNAPRQVSPVVIGIQEMRLPTGDELNPLPPRAASTAGGGDANAYLAWSASGAYLAVKDSTESVARRLRFAIERSGMNLTENNNEGSHRFEYRHTRVPQEKTFFGKMAFWRDNLGPDYSGSYKVRLESDNDETRVYLILETGSPVSTNAAEHILGIFMERLG